MPDSAINYTTTGPNGEIGARFEGVIQAKGMTLDAIEPLVHAPEVPVTGPDPNRIEWRDIINLLYASLETAKVGNDSQFTLRTQSNDALTYAQLILSTNEAAIAPASFNLWAKGIGKSIVVRKLFDSDGSSDYLQLGFSVPNAPMAVTWGNQPIFFNGTAATPSWQPVNHGLGRIPKVVMMPITFQDNGWITPIVNIQPFAPGAPNTAQFFFAARDLLNTVHGPGTIPCPWIAFG